MVDMDRCLGRAVVSLRGHDQGRIYVVIKAEDPFLWVADGQYRPISNLKKKRNKHLKQLSESHHESRLDPEKLLAMHPMSGEADKAIRDFIQSQLNQFKEGEVINGKRRSN